MGSKLAIVADTHWGVRGDNAAFRRNMERFHSEVLFPRLRELRDAGELAGVVHLGDLVDRKKYVNFLTMTSVMTHWVHPIGELGVPWWVVPGNHDVYYYRDTLAVNAPGLLHGWSHSVVTEPRVCEAGGLEFLLTPWVCDDNRQRVLDAMRDADVKVLMGHMDVQGFKRNTHNVSDVGFKREDLLKWHLVLSGHYHHRSTQGNVTYVGSAGQYTWDDYEADRGFALLDVRTLELEYVPNPNPMFVKVFYDDSSGDAAATLADVEAMEGVDDRYVKLVVESKSDPFLFDRVVEKLEGKRVGELLVVDAHMHVDVIEEGELAGAQDTRTILTQAVDSMDTTADRALIKGILNELYEEASK